MPGIVAYTCNLSISEAGKSGVLGQPYTELKVILRYMTPCLKNKQIKKNTDIIIIIPLRAMFTSSRDLRSVDNKYPRWFGH